MKSALIHSSINATMETALRQEFELHFIAEMDDPKSWLVSNGAGIDYVVTSAFNQLETASLDAMPNLKVISNFGVGYDGVDANAACERGVIVTHTPDVLNVDVADTAIMLMLACYRDLVTNDAHVRSAEWAASGNLPLSRSASGRTIGIVGLGRIGLEIARKLSAFDAKILYHTRTARDVEYQHFPNLADMATQSDVLICILPGGDATHHIINAPVMAALGADGILINVARGSVVDQDALIAALQNKTLGGAGLDVYENEPNVPQALIDLSNTVLLPHVGSATVETRGAMAQLTVDNLLQHARGNGVISPVPECTTLVD
jgi:lactate dehydrogenase-like 2-hydroxyacid dehydrogenase